MGTPVTRLSRFDCAGEAQDAMGLEAVAAVKLHDDTVETRADICSAQWLAPPVGLSGKLYLDCRRKQSRLWVTPEKRDERMWPNIHRPCSGVLNCAIHVLLHPLWMYVR